MRQDFFDKLKQDHQKKRRWYRVLMSLAAIVVFCTTYALILPAITMEKQPICGLEQHTHTEECYTQGGTETKKLLDCSYESLGVHVHSDSCYDENHELICGYTDYVVHTHDSSCYDENGALICALPEVSKHVHDASCLDTEGNVVCGKDELHTHIASCYDASGQLICGKLELKEHVHDDSCFKTEEVQTNDPVLTCGKEEHTHTDDCYGKEEKEEVISKQENEAIDEEAIVTISKDTHSTSKNKTSRLKPENIASAKLLYSADDGANWITIVNGTQNIPGNAKLRMEVSYKDIYVDTIVNNNYQFHYELPKIMRNPKAEGDIIDNKTHDVIGTVVANGNQLTLTFNKDWIDKQIANDVKVINGNFYAESEVNRSEVGEDGKVDIILGDTNISVEFEKDILSKYADITIKKTLDQKIIKDGDDEYLEYKLVVTNTGDDMSPDVKVVDFVVGNHAYFSYVGVDGTTKKLTSETSRTPYETIESGKEHGSVYLGGSVTDKSPIPNEGSYDPTKIEEDRLVWVIGDLASKESRSLVYRIKLEGNYSNRTLRNEADVYSKTYKRDSGKTSFYPKATAIFEKNSTNAERQDDGSYFITYTLKVQASNDNLATLRKVIVRDHLKDTKSVALKYISYDEDSFKVFKEQLTGDGEKIKPVMEEDNTGFKCELGDLEKGEIRFIQYTVKVKPEALGAMSGKALNVNNTATLYSDNGNSDSTGYMSQVKKTNTINYDHFAKKQVGTKIEENKTVEMLDGEKFDYTSGKITVDNSDTSSFVVEQGSYQYMVTLNDLADFDITQAIMTDKISNKYMQFSGYARVEAYDPTTQKTTKTAWVKLDGLNAFSYKLSDIGFKETCAYRLTYYAKPVNISEIGQVVVDNKFTLDGTIGKNGNSFTLSGVDSSAKVEIVGGYSFNAEKRYWHKDNADLSNEWRNGELHWMIKVSGTKLVAGTQIQDYVTPNTDNNDFAEGSLVGVYTSTNNDIVGTYNHLKAALDAKALNPITGEYYKVETVKGNKSTLTVTITKDIELGEGQYLYVLVKTTPTKLPKGNNSVKYKNYLHTKSGNEDWYERGYDEKEMHESPNIWKTYMKTFTYDGSKVTNVNVTTNGDIATNLLDNAKMTGTFVSWQVKVNRDGDLSGSYSIKDEIPEGMELAYVRLKWRGLSVRGDSGVSVGKIENLSEYKEHEVSAGLDGEPAMPTYFYTKGREVYWRVDNLKTGESDNVEMHYSVDFQVVCRVTDPSVLLGGQSKEYINKVTLIDKDGIVRDTDTSSVNVSTSLIAKSADTKDRPRTIPFTIQINPYGENLLENATEVTIVDEMSETLKLDIKSIKVVNTKTGVEVVPKIKYTNNTLEVTIPDDQPLTITYKASVVGKPDTPVHISNRAYWKGYASSGGSNVEIESYKYAVGGTAGGESKPELEIIKYDENNIANSLEGAEFKMEEGTINENGDFTSNGSTWIGSTDSNGHLIFGDSKTKVMAFDKVYKVVETKAPTGYLLDDTPHYFVIAKQKEDGTYEDYSHYPKDVRIIYDSSTYELQISNRKGEVTVEKLFQDADYSSLKKIDGTYTFGIYDAPNGNLLDKVTITYKENTVTPSNGKAVFRDLEIHKTYYIYELDDNGNPIDMKYDSQGNVTNYDVLPKINGKDYFVYYDNNEVTISDDITQSVGVKVINRVCFAVLPSTGGIGANKVMTTGFILMFVSCAFLLIYKYKR